MSDSQILVMAIELEAVVVLLGFILFQLVQIKHKL